MLNYLTNQEIWLRAVEVLIRRSAGVYTKKDLDDVADYADRVVELANQRFGTYK